MTARRTWLAWLAVAALAALAGCGTAAQPGRTPAPNSADGGQPATQPATLTGACVMGYASEQPAGYAGFTAGYAGFTAGPPKGTTSPDGTYYAPDMAFQVTLTDKGSATVQVSKIGVAFYANGTEQGSATADATGLITAGQSLTWTVRSPLAVDGTGTGDQGNQADGTVPVTAGSCSLVQWGTTP